MGHNISALISQQPINTERLRHYQLAAGFENGYAIVILFEDSLYHWNEALKLSITSADKELSWNCELVHFLAKELAMETYALLETHYQAGRGTQNATLFESGQAVKSNVMIDEALKELGVVRTKEIDEFDTINLSKFRIGECYYWDTLNFADDDPDMVAGRVPKI